MKFVQGRSFFLKSSVPSITIVDKTVTCSCKLFSGHVVSTLIRVLGHVT